MSETVAINGISYILIQSSVVIEAESKKGTKYWQGHVLQDTADFGRFYTGSSSWATTLSGLSKKNWSVPYFATPMNIGKANETNSRNQAFAEFHSMVTKQTRVRNSDKPLPMLANSFGKRKHKVKYPVAVQPKLDGVRMLTDGNEAWSRKNKPYLDEVVAHIFPINLSMTYLDGSELGKIILDGELMLPSKEQVNRVNSATKKYNEDTPNLRYYVYDFIADNLSFLARKELLEDWFGDVEPTNIILVDTFIAKNEEEVMAFHKKFVEEGYEGSIIRDLDAKYAINKRVDAVLKHKDFIDEEFEIIDIIPAGGGSSADVGKFVCRANNGELFESTATGTAEFRRELLTNKQNYIGLYAVVKYRELTGPSGVPFHSNVLDVRETKDQGF